MQKQQFLHTIYLYSLILAVLGRLNAVLFLHDHYSPTSGVREFLKSTTKTTNAMDLNGIGNVNSKQQ